MNDKLSKNSIISQLLMLKCLWHYNFEDFFNNHLHITAPGLLVESEAPNHKKSYEMPMDKSDNKEADTANTREDDMVNSPILWLESDQGIDVNFVFINCIL